MSLIQLSAGRGPLECSWVVGLVAREIEKEALTVGLSCMVLSKEDGEQRRCYKSMVLSVTGDSLDQFLGRWIGTVQWIAPSPFRPSHRRKNWFVSVALLPEITSTHFDEKEVRVDTMRASGAGGQHVNKTDSAVRLTHLPTGTVVTVSVERSQMRNKVLAMRLLQGKLATREAEAMAKQDRVNWQKHNELIRGNPVRLFRR